MLHAFGAPPPFAVVVLAYFVGQVGNTIPIPGAVSGGIVGVLVAFARAGRPRARLGARLPRASPSGCRRRSAWSRSARCAGRWPAGAPRAGSSSGERRPRRSAGRAPRPRRAPSREPALRRMSCAPATSPACRRPPRGAAPAAGLGGSPRSLRRWCTAGVVRLPDLEGVLTDLSDTLGAWTYALVAALAFLETGAFVGLIAPGETAIVLGGVVAAEGGVDLVPIDRSSPGWPRRSATSPASRSASAWAGASSSTTARASASRAPRLERVEDVLRPPRPQGDPHRALHRDRPRGRPVPGRRVGHAPARTSCRGACSARALWATAFTLVGYAFHESFSPPPAR